MKSKTGHIFVCHRSEELNDLESKMNGEIRELSCEDFSFSSCSFLFNELLLDHLYLVRSDLDEYDVTNYTSTFNQYLKTLNQSDEYLYYLVGEFLIQDEYQYASIGVSDHE